MIPLEIVDEIGSTSDALRRRAEAEAGEVALLARRQTGGRGRLGRRWETIEGNLHLSVLLRPGPLRWPGHWSLLAGVALAETVAPFLPDVSGLRLKWPNDLMLGEGKLAGILAEAGQGRSPWLVIGFGVNLAGAPSDLGRPTSCLAAHTSPPAPEAFAPLLLAALQSWRQRYGTEGFDPVRTAWLERAPPLGTKLTLTSTPTLNPGPLPPAGEGDDAPLEGRFAGLSDAGALLLDTPGGRRTIVAGELA